MGTKRSHCIGLLSIGDAAHAMSPVGGVGINLAVQDSVAAANVLATRMTQWLQLALQRRVIARILRDNRPVKPPLLLRLIAATPRLRRIPGWIIGMGIRPEHVRVREVPPAGRNETA